MDIKQDFENGETYHVEVKHSKSGPLTHIAHYPIKSGPRTFKSLNIFSINGKDEDDPERYMINFWKARQKTPSHLGVEEETEFKCEKDEVVRLLDFLDEIYELEGLESGEHVILRKDSPSAEAAASAVQAIKSCESQEKEVLLGLIGSINDMAIDLSDLDLSESSVEKEAIKAEYSIKHARTKSKLIEYRELVDSGEPEKAYQNFFEDNPWMFGQEYTQRIDLRNITNNNEVDFCMESIDGYYDVVEIKTPEKKLLVEDRSHNTYKSSSELSSAIAQIQDYMHSIELNEAHIKLEEDMHMLKPRGKIVIGSNINQEKRKKLRVLNSHLNRITIYTFSDIARLAERLVERYEGTEELPTKTPSAEERS